MGWYLYPHGVPASLFPVYSHWETRRPDCSRVPGQYTLQVWFALAFVAWAGVSAIVEPSLELGGASDG